MVRVKTLFAMSKNMSESDRGDLAEEQRIDDDCTWRPVESEAREGTTPVVEMTVGEDPFTSRSSSPDVSNYDADKVNVVESSAEPLKLEIAEQESANAVTVADEAPMSTTKESDDSVNENPETPKESRSEDPETPKESGSEDSMIKDDLTKELEKESVTEESAGENGSFAQDQIPGDKQEVSAVPEEPKKSLFEQYIGKSSELKEEGTKLFKSGDLVAAKKKYLEALGYAQYMEVELSNEEKAKVFEIVRDSYLHVSDVSHGV